MTRHVSEQLPFANRRQAGTELAEHLDHFKGRNDVVVLALPRGGVPVAYEVAQALDAPLDIFVVRKLGLPGHREFAMGAIASGGVRILNDEVVRTHGIPARAIDQVVREETAELSRRERLYRADLPPLALEGKIVLLIDDGLATGATMTAAVQAIRAHKPAQVVVAVPVGAPETCHEMQEIADHVVCARTPQPFSAVGLWYHDFSETSDDEVRALLRKERELVAARRAPE
jgi:putative phosphoribosyl transferase